jgi:hypothetical protein
VKKAWLKKLKAVEIITVLVGSCLDVLEWERNLLKVLESFAK